MFLKSSFLLPLSSPTCPFPHYSPQYLDYCSNHASCLLAIIVLSILRTLCSIMRLPWSLDKDAQENTNFYFIPTQQVYQLRETWRYHWHDRVISFPAFSSFITAYNAPTALPPLLSPPFFLFVSQFSAQKAFPCAVLSPKCYLRFHLIILWGGSALLPEDPVSHYGTVHGTVNAAGWTRAIALPTSSYL